MTNLNLDLGAVFASGNVSFKVWAPEKKSVSVVIEGENGNGTSDYDLTLKENGFFESRPISAKPGQNYWYKFDGKNKLYPDPASKFQPDGPFGASQIVDMTSFDWSDSDWRGIKPKDHVVYEMHIGTFTTEGTWKAATAQLQELKELGVTTIEMMPVADFTGRYGWGYDGVNLFAPTRLYGAPENLFHFIDRAHAVGLAVILDVVYNHLGPSGNTLHDFSPYYFSQKHKNDWGAGINFDGDHSQFVRDFYLQNALHWLKEYHFDGLRFDATQDVKDESDTYILQEIIGICKAEISHRELFFVVENEPQNNLFITKSSDGGYDCDAMWNDDFHHTAIVSMTGRSEAYYTDYKGSPQEFISAAKYGFLFQGQRYDWQKNRRGSPTLNSLHVHFVHFLENHDQVANSGRGFRLNKITSAGRYRAMSAVLLLFPQIPMLFQGQEFASSHPFFYFADHDSELSALVAKGRKDFLKQFPSLATEEMSALLPDPGNPQTFIQSKLDFHDREKNADIYLLYKDLLAVRRNDPVLKTANHIDGAVLACECFLIRYFGDEDDRLLIVNLGRDLHLHPAPEPLLAPRAGKKWEILWSSESPKYGGSGTADPDGEDNWALPGHAAILLQSASKK